MALRPDSGDPTAELGYLLAEIDKLRVFLQEVRLDFGAIRPASIKDLHIPRARDHLGEVVRSTGNAASEIIDACESIQAVASEVGGDAANRISAALMSIYEACSFHDLTGQRIGKVNSTLEYIEDGLERVARRLSGEEVQSEAPITPVAEPDPGAEVDLLEGPQLPGKGLDQDAIDQLLRG